MPAYEQFRYAVAILNESKAIASSFAENFESAKLSSGLECLVISPMTRPERHPSLRGHPNSRFQHSWKMRSSIERELRVYENLGGRSAILQKLKTFAKLLKMVSRAGLGTGAGVKGA
jgi:hypothetical protein